MQLFQGAQNFKINGATFVDQKGTNNITNVGGHAAAGDTSPEDRTSHPETREPAESTTVPGKYDQLLS